MSTPLRPVAVRLLALAGLAALTLAACAPTESDPALDGIYVGQITPVSSCGVGSLTLTMTQSGSSVGGTYAITGFSTISGVCNGLNGVGALSGDRLSNGYQITLHKGPCSLPLIGTLSGDTFSGTLTNACTTAFATAPFSVTKS
jgi:hypothetical protein